MKYNQIKIKLVETGITGKQLASKVNVTEQTVSRWCSNEFQPSVEKLFEIAEVLGVDVRELLTPSRK